MFASETPNGIKKRFEYMTAVLERYRPATVLDFGCGTGTNLTIPLAGAFPDIRFVGVDNDATTIDYANGINASPNLVFGLIDEAAKRGPYDLIIASEVIEHVDEPGELLIFLRGLLTPKGKLVLTMPNGYGPFEMTAFFETFLHFIGVHAAAYRLAGLILGKNSRLSRPTTADTLAVSPHVNFFSYNRIKGLITGSSFNILEYRPRTFVCGLGFHQLLFTESARRWNARVADSLPARLNSGWMFVAERDETRTPPPPIPYRRGLYERVRKYLNAKRWGVL